MRKFSVALVVPGLFCALLACNPSGGGASSSDILARIDGQAVYAKDLSNRHRMGIYQAEQEFFRSRREIINQAAVERALEMEAKAAGLTAEEYRKREIDDKVPATTEAQISEFLQVNKARIDARMKELPPGQKKPTTQELRDLIGNQLKQRAMQERQQAFFTELRGKHKVETLITEPVAPRVEVGDGGNPSKGSADAKVQIIEFSDFQCPFCARALPVLRQIEETYGNKVRVVFRDFPLSFHNTALVQAQAGGCANDQSKFWEFHDKIFESQDRVARAFSGGSLKSLHQELTKIATEAGIKGDEFQKCLESDKHAAEVAKDMKDAEDAGVSSTPSFFVNGRLIAGALPFQEFKKIIDEELAK